MNLTYPDLDSSEEMEDMKHNLGFLLSCDLGPLTGPHQRVLVVVMNCNLSTWDPGKLWDKVENCAVK